MATVSNLVVIVQTFYVNNVIAPHLMSLVSGLVHDVSTSSEDFYLSSALWLEYFIYLKDLVHVVPYFTIILPTSCNDYYNLYFVSVNTNWIHFIMANKSVSEITTIITIWMSFYYSKYIYINIYILIKKHIS